MTRGLAPLLGVLVLAVAALWLWRSGHLAMATQGVVERGVAEEASVVSPPVSPPAGDEVRGAPAVGGSERETVSAAFLRLLVEGQPVAGAEVWIVPLGEGMRARLESRFGVPGAELKGASLSRRSDEEGRVDLEGVRIPAFVAARGPGTAPGGLFLTAFPEAGAVWELPAEEVVRGRVIGMHVGEPLGDVWVYGRRKYEHPAESYGDPNRIAGMFFESRVRPQADGRFELRGLGRGYVDIAAMAPGRRSQDDFRLRLPLDDELVLKLLDGPVVAGRVVAKEGGEPVAGAVVEQVQPAGEFEQYVLARTLTEADGGFALQCVNTLEGAATLRVQAGGFASRSLDLDAARVRSGGAVVVELSRECVTQGRVLSTDGKPFADTVWVQIRPTGRRIWTSIVTCDESGTYTLNGVDPAVLYDVFAQTTDHYRAGYIETHPCEGGDLDIELDPAPTIDGRVIDQDGEPVPGSRVRLSQEDLAGNRVYEHVGAPDDSTGEFHLPAGMGAGSYLLEAWAPGYPPTRIEPVTAQPPPAKTDPIEVKLRPGRVVQGHVVDAETGMPVVSAEVRLGEVLLSGEVLEGSTFMDPVRTDGEGFFRLEGYPRTGAWPLLVSAPGYATARVDVERKEGSLEPWTLGTVELVRAANVSVRAFDVDGRAFTSVLVVAQGPSDERRRVESGPDGVARVEGLAPGKWYFDVILHETGIVGLNSRDHSLRVEVKAGERKDLDIRLKGATIFGRLSGEAVRAARGWYNRVVIVAHPQPPMADLDELGVWVVNDRYELRGVPAGRYRLEARSIERTLGFSKSRIVDVPASGAIEVDFEVPATGFEGVVTGEDGKPLADASVWAAPLRAEDDRLSTDGARMRTHSGPDGGYVLLGLAPGRYAVGVEREGFGREVRVASVGEGEERREVNFTLRPEAVVEVEVRSRGGSELPGASVRLERVGEPELFEEEAEAVSGEEALWRFGALPETEVRVEVKAAGHFGEDRIVRTRAGEVERVEFSLRRLGSLRLRVKRLEGGAAGGWPVAVVDEETGTSVSSWLESREVTSSTGSLVTDKEGVLVLVGLPEGRYRVSAGGPVEHAVVAPGGEAAEASVTTGG